jgi:uncharacterized delta-60 repeat protein
MQGPFQSAQERMTRAVTGRACDMRCSRAVSLISLQATGNGVAIQTDGKIVVAGSDGFHIAVVRCNSNGILDTTFNGTGGVTTPIDTQDRANAVALQTDGKIVVAGAIINTSGPSIAVVRYNTNGALDNTFNGTGKVITSDPNGAAGNVAIRSLIPGNVAAALLKE